MKANAPEKIYISPLPNHSDGYVGVAWDEPHKTMVEYTRTDAFIEKAAKWLEEHKEFVETEDNGIMGWIPDYFIEDFKKALK